MARMPIPLVIDEYFYLSGHEDTEVSMQVGSRAWHDWLADKQHKSFSFRSRLGSFTARHESQRHGWYWYAYRKRDSKTYKTYLGKSTELTFERLQTVATALSYKSTDYYIQAEQIPEQTYLSLQDTSIQPLALKFLVPSTCTELLPRPQLIARLEAGRKGKLTVLSAPAGWGKTTLLSEWCAMLRAQKVPFAWLSLDASDQDPTNFWAHLIMAFQTIQPTIGNAALALLLNSTAVSIETVLKTLQQELRFLSAESTLILDDCHHLLSTQTHTALSFFLDHLPPHIHLVIASRNAPCLSLARLRVQGKLLEIKASDLAFTAQEAFTLLRETRGLQLSYSTCTSLIEHTEGWPAGLYLATFALQNAAVPCENVAMFSGSDHYVIDYLVEEVLSKQSQEVQDFLLHTSILTHMNGALCDAVCESENSQAQLESLAQMNLFILPLDYKKMDYRYYRLFAEALHSRLQQLHPTLESELQRRASRWHEQQGMQAKALHHALATADDSLVLRLLEQHTPELMLAHQLQVILDWFYALPTLFIRANGSLSLLHAYILLYKQEQEQAEACLQDAERWLKKQLSTEHAHSVANYLAAIHSVLAQSPINGAMNEHSTQRTLSIQRARELLGLFLRQVPAYNASMDYVHILIATFDKEYGCPVTSQQFCAPPTHEQLTNRERDVLSLLMNGASNREIAQNLIISEGTVKKHVSNICSKLNVQRRTQVITKALAMALL